MAPQTRRSEMEGYFVIVSKAGTFERVGIFDVADGGAALDIYEAKKKEGYAVSIWKGTRVRVTVPKEEK